MFVVLFDIDATLLRTGGAGRAAFAETLCAEFGIERIRGGISHAGRSDRGIARDVFARYGIEDTPGTWERFRRGYLQTARTPARRPPGRAAAGGPAAAAHDTRRSDVAAGILTGNVAGGARLKLVRYGIDSFFDFGGFGDDHADRDGIAAEAMGAADVFLRSHHRLPADPRRTTVIGDTPEDVRCARSIAAKAVAVATGASSMSELAAEAPVRVFPDLTDRDAIMEIVTAA